MSKNWPRRKHDYVFQQAEQRDAACLVVHKKFHFLDQAVHSLRRNQWVGSNARHNEDIPDLGEEESEKCLFYNLLSPGERKIVMREY
jgi:hypothetical protein